MKPDLIMSGIVSLLLVLQWGCAKSEPINSIEISSSSLQQTKWVGSLECYNTIKVGDYKKQQVGIDFSTETEGYVSIYHDGATPARIQPFTFKVSGKRITFNPVSNGELSIEKG